MFRILFVCIHFQVWLSSVYWCSHALIDRQFYIVFQQIFIGSLFFLICVVDTKRDNYFSKCGTVEALFTKPDYLLKIEANKTIIYLKKIQIIWKEKYWTSAEMLGRLNVDQIY